MQVTGARLIGSWLGAEPLSRADLGAVGLMTVRPLHGRQFVEVTPAGEAGLACLGSRCGGLLLLVAPGSC